jgi:hypothetical protein
MIDFPEINNEKMGGASSFNFIPQYSVSSIPNLSVNVITTPLVLKTGCAWLKGLSLPKSLTFNEVMKESDAGVLYEYTVTGSYPGQTPDLSALFAEMKPQPFVLDVTDNNNQRRLLGTLSNPVQFKYGYSSKDNPSQRPEYTFSFSYTSQKPAPFYLSV